MRRRLQRYVWVGVLPVFGGMFAVLNGKLGAAGTARPLSIAPAQGDECPLLAGFCANVPRGRRATIALPKMLVGGVCVSRPAFGLG